MMMTNTKSIHLMMMILFSLGSFSTRYNDDDDNDNDNDDDDDDDDDDEKDKGIRRKISKVIAVGRSAARCTADSTASARPKK